MEGSVPRVVTNFDPRGMVGKISVGVFYTLLYINCEPRGFREDDFCFVFPHSQWKLLIDP